MGVCCYTFLKYLSVIWNLLFMVVGGAWLGGVLWVFFNDTDFAIVTKDVEGFNYVLYFLMVVGAIVFILGLLGCCGACQESQCMLATFFALVLVLFCGQVAIFAWVRANEPRFFGIFTDTVTASIKQDYGKDEVKTKAFDSIQTNLKCCGSKEVTDWVDSYFNGAGREQSGGEASQGEYQVPDSCCVEKGCDTTLLVSQDIPPRIHSEGCSDKMKNLIKTYSSEILYSLLAVLLVQVLAMVLSMVLCCTVRRIDHVKA